MFDVSRILFLFSLHKRSKLFKEVILMNVSNLIESYLDDFAVISSLF
jgi:hypothetical protein